MELFNLMHAKVLYLRFCAIYDHKFVKTYHDEDYKSLWANEWSDSLSQINPNIIKDALDYCKKNLEWPPSVAEFLKICESFMGIPSAQECFKLSLNRNFTHPIVLLCYEKVGSWAMKNDTEKQLTVKFQAAYQAALNEFRADGLQAWEQLESFNAKLKELPAPGKIPTTSESKSFKECMTKCQEILKGKTNTAGGKTYKHFDDNKIKKGHKEFDQQVFSEWRAYLLSIPETDTMILPPEYAYDRARFIAQEEQLSLLKDAGYIPSNQRPYQEPPRTGHAKPTKMYKNWHGD